MSGIIPILNPHAEDQQFIATITDQKKVRKRIVISTKCDKNELPALISKIYQKEEDNLKLSRAIKIQTVTKETCTYQIGDKVSSIRLESDKSDLKIDFYPLSPSQNSAPITHAQGFKAHWVQLLDSHKTSCCLNKIPLINLVWMYIIAPIIAFITSQLERRKANAEFTQAKPQYEHFRRVAGLEGGFESLISTLEESVELIKNADSSPEHGQLIKQTQECLSVGHEIQKSLKAGKSAKEIAEKFSKVILSRLGERSEAPLLIVPSGYYSDSIYYPMLLTFYCDKQGRLCLEKLTSDPKAKENSEKSRITYVLNNPESAENGLATFLTMVILLQKPLPTNSEVKTEAEQNHAMLLQAYQKPSDHDERFSQFFKTKREMHVLFDGYIGHCQGIVQVNGIDQQIQVKEADEKGGKAHHAVSIQTQDPPKKPLAKADSWHLLGKWYRTHFPEVRAVDKLSLTITVLTHHLEISLKTIYAMSADDRIKMIPIIRQDIDKLQRVVNKGFGDEQAFGRLSKENDFFLSLSKQMDALENSLKEFSEADMRLAATACQEAFQKTAKTELRVPFITNRAPIESCKEIDPDFSFVLKNQGKLTLLRQAFLKAPDAAAKEATGLFVELSQEVAKLADLGDWKQLMALHTQIMSTLPIPNPSAIWEKEKELAPAATGFWEKFPNYEQADLFSKALSEMSLCVLEAKLRLGDDFAWPTERLDIFTGHAVLSRLTQTKAMLLRKKYEGRETSAWKEKLVVWKEKIWVRYTTDLKAQRKLTCLIPFAAFAKNWMSAFIMKQWGVQTLSRDQESKIWALNLNFPDIEECAKSNVKLTNEDINNLMTDYVVSRTSHASQGLNAKEKREIADNWLISHWKTHHLTGLEHAQFLAEYCQCNQIPPEEGREMLLEYYTYSHAFGRTHLYVEKFALTDNPEQSSRCQLLSHFFYHEDNISRITACQSDNRKFPYASTDMCLNKWSVTKHKTGFGPISFGSGNVSPHNELDNFLVAIEVFNGVYQNQGRDADLICKQLSSAGVPVARYEELFSCVQRSSTSKQLLPNSVIDLRRYFIMESVLVNSSALHRNFPDTSQGQNDADKWHNEIYNKAKVQKDQYDLLLAGLNKEKQMASGKHRIQLERKCEHALMSKKKITYDLYRQESLNQFQTLKGRLEITVKPSYDVHTPTIEIVSRDHPNEPGLSYYANRTFTNDNGPLFSKYSMNYLIDVHNPFIRHSILGNTPARLIDKAVCSKTPYYSKDKGELTYEGIILPYDGYQLEPTILLEASNNSQGSPLDEYVLSTLNHATDTYSQYSSSVDVLQNLLSNSSGIDPLRLISQQTHLLENEENQRVIVLALFQKGLLAELMDANPEFFLDRLEKFQELISKALSRKDNKTAAFIMFIGNRIAKFADAKRKQSSVVIEFDEKGRAESDVKWAANSGSIYDKLAQFPSYNTQYTIEKNAKECETVTGYRFLTDRLIEDDQNKYFICFFFDWFKNESTKDVRDKLISEPESRQLLLTGYANLKKFSSDAGLPFIQQQALQWFEYFFIPSLSINVQKAFFSTRGIIPATALPVEITSTPAFKTVFGNEIIKTVGRPVNGNSAFEVEYAFQLKNRDFKIIYDSRTKSVQIYQHIPDHLSSNMSGWYRYAAVDKKIRTHEEVIELSNAELIIAMRGVWIHSSNSTALVMLKPPLVCEAFHILKLNAAKTKAETIVPNGKNQLLEVCQDHEGVLTKWFSFTSSDNILFLKEKGAKVPTEIRILSHDIILQKENEGWKVVKGRGKGSLWITDFSNHDAIQTSTKEFVKTLGFQMPVSMLPLTNGKEERFIVFPFGQKISDDQTLLEIDIKEGGEIASSCAGYLYLAWMYQQTDQTKHALHFLNAATMAHMIPSEQVVFHRIVDAITNQPARTLRQVAFKLKVELAVRRIRKEVFSNSKEYASEEASLKIVQLHRQYKVEMERALQRREKGIIESDLVLTDAEKLEYDFICSECIHLALSDILSSPQIPPPVPKRLEVALKEMTAHNYIGATFGLMANPSEVPPSLSEIIYLSPDNVIKHFWQYVVQLKSMSRAERLKTAKILYVATIQKIKAGVEKEVPDEALEFARKFLIMLATDYDAFSEFKFSKDTLEQIESDLNWWPLKSYQREMRKLIKLPTNQNDLSDFYASKNALHYVDKKLMEIWSGVISSVIARVTETVADGILTLSSTTAIDKQQKTEAQKKATTSLNALQDLCRNPNTSLSMSEKMAIEGAIKTISGADKDLVSKQHSIDELVALLKEKAEMNLQESRQLESTISAVTHLEKALKSKVAEVDQKHAHGIPQHYATIKIDAEVTGFESLEKEYFHEVDSKDSQIEKQLNEDVSQMMKVLESESKTKLSDVEKAENRELAIGFKAAAEKIASQAAHKRSITPQKLTTLKAKIAQRENVLHARLNLAREEILKWAASDQAPKVLNQLSLDIATIGTAAIIEKAVDLYQKGLLRKNSVSQEDVRGAELITKFLLDSTELQQISAANEKVNALFNLDRQLNELRKKLDDANVVIKQVIIDYDTCANDLMITLKAGFSKDRYVNNHLLADQVYNRKFLVTEYRSARILRKAQTELIRRIVANPNCLAQLIMGSGKTTFIMPIVMQLLAEGGALPIALMTKELIKLQSTPMDASTRGFFRQASMIFEFEANDLSCNESFLAKKYLYLLHAKAEQGYVITTIEDKSNLENGIKKLSNDILNLSQSNQPNALEDIIRLKKVQYWLCKIRTLFSKDHDLGFTTQFFADEGDYIFDVRNENNQALGQRNPDKNVIAATKALTELLMKNLPELNVALAKNSQSALTATHFANSMQALAKLSYQHLISQSTQKLISEKEWIEYVTTPDSAVVEMDPNKNRMHTIFTRLDPEVKKLISSLKRLISSTCTACLQKNLNIDLGVRNRDGCVVVPFQNKVERMNTQFGDEFDLIMSHFLYYAVKAPSDEFLEETVRKLAVLDATRFDEIMTEAIKINAAKPDLIAYLKTPQAWEHRIAILVRFVLNDQYIKLSEEQITLNVHKAIRDSNLGVASGTMNPASLPEGLVAAPKQLSRAVEAETYLLIALGKQPVKVIPDAEILKQMADALKDRNIKSIINPGVAIEGFNTLQIIENLRNKNPARQFIFIHPDPEIRTAYMWNPGSNAPEPFDSAKLDANICLFYFDPADTRGTDFKIPPGLNILLSGPTTQQSVYAQAAWRVRMLGVIQKVIPWIVESVAERIRSEQDVKEIAFAHIVNDIKKKTLEEQAMLNYKTVSERIQGFAFVGMCNINYREVADYHSRAFDSRTGDGSLRIQADIAVSNLLFVASRDLMIQSRRIDFDNELVPCFQEAVFGPKGKIDKAYLQQIENLRAIKKRIESECQALYRQFTRPGVKRLDEALKQIDGLIAEVESAHKTDLSQQKQEQWKKHLPQHVPSNASGRENSFEQAQQQVQQQATQLVQVQAQQLQSSAHQFTKSSKAEYRYKCPSFVGILKQDKLRQEYLHINEEYTPIPKHAEDVFKIPQLKGQHLRVTASVDELLEILPSPNGTPIASLLIIKCPNMWNEIRYRVCLIGKNDLHATLYQTTPDTLKPGEEFFVYDFEPTANPKSFNENYSFTWSLGKTKPDVHHPELLQQCALARILMGYDNFSPGEKAVLRKLFNDASFDFAGFLGTIKIRSPHLVNVLSGIKRG